MHLIPPPRGDTHLTFIGGGTMACAVLDGLVSSGLTTFVPNRKPKYSFSITARRQDHALELWERYPGAYITIDNSDENLWQFPDDDQPSAHLVLICTKPDSTHEVCQRIVLAHDAAPAHRALPTVITMCPGIKVSTLESWLDRGDGQSRFPVIRTMPNTPVSLRQGTTALIASPRATADQVDRVVELFRVFSPCVEILPDEELLNVAAAVSGYGFPGLCTTKKKEKPVCGFADLLPAPDRHTSSSSTSLSSPAGFAMDSQRRWRAPS
jgi:pyrroline-5-carboxylate reductase